MNESARYAKIVEWSDEDECFVGSSPGLTISRPVPSSTGELCQMSGNRKQRLVSVC
jgi:hypothetical protein